MCELVGGEDKVAEWCKDWKGQGPPLVFPSIAVDSIQMVLYPILASQSTVPMMTLTIDRWTTGTMMVIGSSIFSTALSKHCL